MDLIGFGRSDKPSAVSDYTYLLHVEWATAWFDAAPNWRPGSWPGMRRRADPLD
jgi:hypothetical protein